MGGKGSPALQEKWNLEMLRCDKWDCCLTLSCSLIGSEQLDPFVCDWSSDSGQWSDVDNCVEFIKPRWGPVIVFILPWPFYLICPSLALQHLLPVSSADMVCGRGLFGRRLCVGHVGRASDRPVSAQRRDAISIKTFCSVEPCQPTMESSVTQSAAGQRAPSFIKGLE